MSIVIALSLLVAALRVPQSSHNCAGKTASVCNPEYEKENMK